MRRFSVATVLLGLFAVMIVPLGIYVAFLIAQLQANEEISMQTRTTRNAVAISRAVEPVISEMSAILNLVTSIEEVEYENLFLLHRRLKKELSKTGNYFVVLGQNGQQLLNTRTGFGIALDSMSTTDDLQSVLESDGINVSNLHRDEVSEDWTFSVINSLNGDGQTHLRAALISRNTSDLNRAFETLILPSQWQAVIVDGSGQIINAKENAETLTGSRIELPGDLQALSFSDANGFTNATTEDGTNHLVGYSEIRGTKWKGFVYGPIASAQKSILTMWYKLILGGMVILAITSIALYVFSQNLNSSIRGVVKMARQMGAGEIVSPVDTRIEEINFIATTLSEASFDRSQKEDTIKIVMQELSHRTKNLIAVVISVVRQTAQRSTSPENMTSSLIERIMGLGHSIDLLTAKDWGAVPLSDLLEKQLSNFGIVGKSVILDGPEVFLKPEAVQHLGMAIHELATNALKYGALSVDTGEVKIYWKIREENEVEKLILKWREKGGPAPEKPDHEGFGTQILDRYVASAFAGNSELSYEKDGLSWRLKGVLSRFTGAKYCPVTDKRKF